MSEPEAPEAMDDGEEAEEERGPFRRCLVTRESRPREVLVRFVIGPDGTVVPDIEERLPGRGFWLSATRDVVNTAVARNVFAKAAKARVSVPPGLADLVEARLAARCLGLLGLARKAGQVAAGFEKVRERLRAGPVGLLVEASDGMPDGRSRVEALAPGVPRVEVFTGAELGAAMGRERQVHISVDDGALARRLERETARLAGFRRLGMGDAGMMGRTDERTN